MAAMAASIYRLSFLSVLAIAANLVAAPRAIAEAESIKPETAIAQAAVQPASPGTTAPPPAVPPTTAPNPATTPATPAAAPITEVVPSADLLKELQANPAPFQLPNQPSQVKIDSLQPLTLEQALNLARLNNPQIQIRQLQVEQSRAGLRIVEASLYPTLGLQGTTSYQQTGNRSTVNDGAPGQPAGSSLFTTQGQTSIGASLNLNYTIFDFVRGAQLAASRDRITQAELDLEAILEDLQLSVSEAYYQLQNADQLVRIARESVVASERSLRDAEALFRAGVGTQFDVLRQQVQLAQDQQNLVDSLGSQDQLRRQLAQVLNLPQNVNVLTADPVELAEPWNLSLDESIVLAFQNRPELERELLERNISLNQAQAARGEILPQLGLQASYGLTGSRNSDLRSGSQSLTFPSPNSTNNSNYSYSIGLVLNVPLFDGGAANARAVQQELNGQIAEQNFILTRNQIRTDVETAFFGLQTNLANIGTTRKAVEQAREALRLARLRFQAGVGTQTEVIDSQRDLTRAEANALNAITAYNLALARIKRAVSNINQVAQIANP